MGPALKSQAAHCFVPKKQRASKLLKTQVTSVEGKGGDAVYSHVC